MTYRTTITLDEDACVFLQQQGIRNRSAYINALLKKEQQLSLTDQILKANQEEACDLDYQEELSVWQETLLDGLSGSSR